MHSLIVSNETYDSKAKPSTTPFKIKSTVSLSSNLGAKNVYAEFVKISKAAISRARDFIINNIYFNKLLR